jgi:hypothetical protein
MRSASGKRQRQAARIASGTQAGHGYGPGPALSVLKSPFSEATPLGIRSAYFVPNPGGISTSSDGKSWLREDLPRKGLWRQSRSPPIPTHARSDSSRRHDRRMETRSASALHPVHRWRRTGGADTISSVSDQIFEFSQRLNRFSAPLLPNTQFRKVTSI